jgi:hypothetical protein
MKREDGKKEFPIWLLGDSEPANWQDILDTPFDPRHPARHNIWTSVLDVIQDKVYREKGIRLDSSKIFIRNAVKEPTDKPTNKDVVWNGQVLKELSHFQKLVTENRPTIIFSFGAFSYEFGRRSLGEKLEKPFKYWNSKKLGEEFRLKLQGFDPNSITLLPLLHRSVSSGKFIQGQEQFCNLDKANYFDIVGKHIATVLLENIQNLNIWIK